MHIGALLCLVPCGQALPTGLGTTSPRTGLRPRQSCKGCTQGERLPHRQPAVARPLRPMTAAEHHDMAVGFPPLRLPADRASMHHWLLHLLLFRLPW